MNRLPFVSCDIRGYQVLRLTASGSLLAKSWNRVVRPGWVMAGIVYDLHFRFYHCRLLLHQVQLLYCINSLEHTGADPSWAET